MGGDEGLERRDTVGAAVVTVTVDHHQAVLPARDRRQRGCALPPGVDLIGIACRCVLPSLQQRTLVRAGGKDLDAGSGERQRGVEVVLDASPWRTSRRVGREQEMRAGESLPPGRCGSKRDVIVHVIDGRPLRWRPR